MSFYILSEFKPPLEHSGWPLSRKPKERAELVPFWRFEWFTKMSQDCVWLWGQSLQWDYCLPVLFLHTPHVVYKWPPYFAFLQCSGMWIPHFLFNSHKNAMLYVLSLISGTLTIQDVRWNTNIIHKGLQHPQTVWIMLQNCKLLILKWEKDAFGILFVLYSKTATTHRCCAHSNILRGWMSRKN